MSHVWVWHFAKLDLRELVDGHPCDDMRLIFENNDVMPRWLPSEHVELNVEEDVLTVEVGRPRRGRERR